MRRKLIQPGEKVPLKLTAAEQKLVLEDLICLDQDYEQNIKETPAGKAVMFTLDELDDFGGYIAAEANHCDDAKKQKKLDAIFQKIQKLADKYSEEKQAKPLKTGDAHTAKVVSNQAIQIAEWTAQALAAAEQLRIRTKPLEHFWLANAQREVLLLAPSLSKPIRNKLANDESSFTVAEVASMALALAEDLPDGGPQKQLAALLVAKHLMDRLQEGITSAASPKASQKPKRSTRTTTGVLYQFKITLLGFETPIWRRIQVEDCTLDKLHEHIQTSMGWTNSHSHQFKIEGERYGDPELLDDGFDGFDCVDSRVTMVSNVVPKSGERFSFSYEYDFGDGWEHEILFEGCPPAEKRRKYPLCVEGERACPPEDVGGIWGYDEFLEALANPNHEEHESYLEWCGGSFSPDKFDPEQATRKMRKGLPDWRSMR